MTDQVGSGQRFKKNKRCPVCGGCEQDPRGQKRRCTGYLSTDGEWCRCSRPEHAGGLELEESSGCYVHKMSGPCKCGDTHGEGRPTLEPERVYSYKDEHGAELFQVVRMPGKKFLQRVAQGDRYVWKMAGIRRVPYGLDRLVASTGEVWFVEGERDVESLWGLGLVATCNPGGAGKVHLIADEARKALGGRHVIVVADRDPEEKDFVGQRHAVDVRRILSDVAASVRVLVSPGPEKDVTDLLTAGRDLSVLVDLGPGPWGGAPAEPFEPPPGMFDDPAPDSAPDLHSAPDVERHVVAASLFSRECLAVAIESVSLDHFTDTKMMAIWGACQEAKGKGLGADPTTIAAMLHGHGKLDEIGGRDFLIGMANGIAVHEPTAEQTSDHVKILQGKMIERKAVQLAQLAASEISRANGSTMAVTQKFAADMTALVQLAKPSSGFEWIRGAELASPEPELTYLIPSLGMTDGAGPPHLFAGRGESGKTILCQDLLLSLASMRDAWGAFPSSRPCRVAHIDLEQGRRLTKMRYQRLANARAIDLHETPVDVVCFPSGLRLDRTQASRWTDAMGGREAVLVDSLRVAMRGADENSSEFRDGLDLLAEISEQTGCRAIIIHHLRKASKDASDFLEEMIRGSAAIYEALDCAFILRKGDGEDVSVHQKKARAHGEHCEPFAFSVANVEGPTGPRWGLRISIVGMERVEQQRATAATERLAREQDSARARVLAGLTRYPDSTAEDLATRISMRPATVRVALTDLCSGDSPRAASRETPSGEGRGGRPKRLFRAI